MLVLTHSTIHGGLVDLLVLLSERDSSGNTTVHRTASVRRKKLKSWEHRRADTAVGYMVNELKELSSRGGVPSTSRFSILRSAKSGKPAHRTDSAARWRQTFRQHLDTEMVPTAALKGTIPRLRSAVHVCFYDHDEKDDFEQASEADNGLACHRTWSEPDPMTLENVDGREKRFYD